MQIHDYKSIKRSAFSIIKSDNNTLDTNNQRASFLQHLAWKWSGPIVKEKMKKK